MATSGDLTDEAMETLGEEYETSVDMGWVEDLVRRYGLEVTI